MLLAGSGDPRRRSNLVYMGMEPLLCAIYLASADARHGCWSPGFEGCPKCPIAEGVQLWGR